VPVSRSHVRFQEIAAEIRRRILAGEVRPGERVGTYESLGEDFRAAIGTIRNAIGVLADEGLITTTQGVGIFVVDPLSPGDRRPVDESLGATSERLAALDKQLGSLGTELHDLQQKVAALEQGNADLRALMMDLYSRLAQPYPGSAPEGAARSAQTG
jgi:DNA-binding GntR family transcriptional regulator